MTSHGLVRCSPERLLGHVAQRYAAGSSARVGPVPRWRYAEPDAGRTRSWRTRLPDGSILEWCLEVEPGANGVLAHLSAALVSGRLARLPASLRRLALWGCTEHELAGLAQAVETGGRARAVRRQAAIG